MRLYVGNLSYHTDEQQLEQLFASLGDVASVKLIRDHATGQSRGFGFVEMADGDAGRTACEQLNQHELDGRRLTVNEAKPQEQRSGGFARGGGGGGRQRRESRW
jgi:RNA recognition motif-containing protein